MPDIGPALDSKTYTVTIKKEELKQILCDKATSEINKGHMAGNFKPAFMSPDGYGGWRILFVQVDDKKFKEVEPLDF